MGPITIFDKSALQSLSMDESVWLDAFFLVNVVPLFCETLADLEKDVAEGKSPEDLVGMLAAKTPPNAVPNVHHRSLISAELTGWNVPMDGRVPIAGGGMMRGPEGDVGVHVEEFDEAVALTRWKNHEFLEIERHIAKRWRAELVGDPDRDRKIAILRNILPLDARISDLPALKLAIDAFCNSADRPTIALALNVLGVPEESARAVLARWERAGGPTLEAFATYTTHVFKVDLLYYLGVDRGFISGERASNQTDMAYLYYLPFCMLFTSGDNLHRRTAPLFLRSDQSFAYAAAFKAALRELDDYYTRLPEEIKELGVMAFAHYPPTDLDNLVVDLWDKHMRPDWRDDAETPEQVLARWQRCRRKAASLRFAPASRPRSQLLTASANLKMANPTTSSSAGRCRSTRASGDSFPRTPRRARGAPGSETVVQRPRSRHVPLSRRRCGSTLT